MFEVKIDEPANVLCDNQGVVNISSKIDSALNKKWLKGSNIIKLNSDAAVTRVTYEVITNFDSLTYFDKASSKYLPRTCKYTIPAISEDILLAFPLHRWYEAQMWSISPFGA